MSHEMVILSPESMSDRAGQVYTDSRTEKEVIDNDYFRSIMSEKSINDSSGWQSGTGSGGCVIFGRRRRIRGDHGRVRVR